MDFILPLTFLIFSSGMYSIIFKKNICETIPFTIIISSLILYIFGILNILPIGFYILSLSCLIFPIYMIIKQKEILNIKPLILNNGLYIFIVLYTLIYFLNLNRGFSSYDEISHWGPMVKEILRTGKLYCCESSNLLAHRDYPPIFQIWESFWCFLCLGFKEPCLYKALQTACLSFFLPIFTNSSKRNIIYFLLCPICLISICNTIPLEDGNFCDTIYLDAPIALLSAYCVYLLIKDKINNDELDLFSKIQITSSLSFLVITKQIGIFFYLISICIFIISKLFKSKNRIKAISILLITIILPTGFLFSWKLFSKNSTSQFNVQKIQLNEIPTIIKGQDKNFSTKHQIYLNFKKAIDNQDLALKTVIPNFNFLVISIILLISIFIYTNIEQQNVKLSKILIILSFLILLFQKITYFTGLNIIFGLFLLLISSKEEKLKSNITYSILYLGGYAYYIAIMILYFFCFVPYESLRLASFIRYMNTYLLFLLAITAMIFFQKITYSKKTELNLAIFLVFIAIFNIVKGEINIRIPYKNTSITNRYLEDSKIIESNTKEDDKIYIISQKNDGSSFFTLSYLTSPRKYNMDNFSIGKSEGDIFTKDISITELSKFLIEGNYEYLYIQKIDENFIINYATMFKDKNPIEKHIYKIEKQENKNVMFK